MNTDEIGQVRSENWWTEVLPRDDWMTISSGLSSKAEIFKRILIRLVPIILLTSIIFTAINSGMAQKTGEAIDDVGWQYAAAISATYAADPPPPFTYYVDIHEALDLNGLGKNDLALANLGTTYPENLSQGQILTEAIQKAIEVAKSPQLDTARIKPMPYTDFGLPVFLALSLKIFGASISSSLYLLLVLLSISTVMFLVTFWNRALDLVTLSAALTGCLILTIFISKDVSNYELLTLAGQRSISILAILPALYLVLITSSLEKPSSIAMIFTCFQALILSFSVSLRSSISWLLFIVLLIIICFYFRQKRQYLDHEKSLPKKMWSATPAIIICSLVFLNSLITVLKFIWSRGPFTNKGDFSWQIPLIPQLAPYLVVIFGCIAVALFLFLKTRRSSHHSLQNGPGKAVVVIALSLISPQIALNLVTPIRYYSDDVLPHHVRNSGAILGLTFSEETAKLFPEVVAEGQDIFLGDTFAYAVSYLEYESTLAGQPYVPYPKENWQDRAKKRGFFSPVTNTWKFRLVDFYAGKAFGRIVKEHPVAVAKAYPLKIVRWKESISESISRTGLQAHLLVAFTLFFVCGSFAGRRANKKLTGETIRPLLTLTTLFIASFLPLIWAYPAIHVMVDNIIFFLMMMLMMSFIFGMLIIQMPLRAKGLVKKYAEKNLPSCSRSASSRRRVTRSDGLEPPTF